MSSASFSCFEALSNQLVVNKQKNYNDCNVSSKLKIVMLQKRLKSKTFASCLKENSSYTQRWWKKFTSFMQPAVRSEKQI